MKEETYYALSKAAERIGLNAASVQMQRHLKKGRKRSTFRFDPPQIQRDIIEAMGSRTIADEEAIALLWSYDAMQWRFNSDKAQ